MTQVQPASGPYTERPIRFLEVWSHAGWRLKVYSISAKGEFCDPDLVASAKDVATENLPHPALSPKKPSTISIKL